MRQPATTMTRFDQMLSATVLGIETSILRYMPPGAYRDFCLWALSVENPNRMAWLQVMGVLQTVRLTEKLLEGIVDDDEWARIVKTSVPLNVYLTFEVISDNLAIGLATKQVDDRSYAMRRELLAAFNRVVIARLNGDPEDTGHLLAAWQPIAERISSFQQSLSPAKHQSLVRPYLNGRPSIAQSDVEYGIWHGLIVNAETCLEVAEVVRAFKTGPLILQGLVDRYRAVCALLEETEMSPARRALVGAQAILVSPVLAYYLAFFAEQIRPTTEFSEVVEDSTLEGALYDAALLVRLLNDMGTGLLTQEDERAEMLRFLQLEAEKVGGQLTLGGFILQMVDKFPLLTRIHKDTLFAEFNVCLQGISELDAQSGLIVFGSRLQHYHNLYAQTYLHFNEILAVIDERLGDTTVSTLVSRFVQFHVALYSQSHQENAGEYAV